MISQLRVNKLILQTSAMNKNKVQVLKSEVSQNQDTTTIKIENQRNLQGKQSCKFV